MSLRQLRVPFFNLRIVEKQHMLIFETGFLCIAIENIDALFGSDDCMILLLPSDDNIK